MSDKKIKLNGDDKTIVNSQFRDAVRRVTGIEIKCSPASPVFDAVSTAVLRDLTDEQTTAVTELLKKEYDWD